MTKPSVSFQHFGCKVNFAESSSLAKAFREEGFEVKQAGEHAAMHVVNTCMVTASAEKKCRAAIRKLHQQDPEAIIAVIGCFSELKADQLAGMDGVKIILGHQDKFDLLQVATDFFDIKFNNNPDYQAIEPSKPSTTPPPWGTYHPAFSIDGRTRSFLKIQDGCDYHCAYCTIPLARGRSRSDTIDAIVQQAQEIAKNGIREIVLTGVNIGDFGKHQGESLLGLLKALEQDQPVPRIRLSSIEPDLLLPEIIDLVAQSRMFLPSFHIPLQSGSNRILQLMKRKYATDLFKERVLYIKECIPDACIAADVITGFPGETEEEFEETIRFLDGLPLSYMHVFSYSKRDQTLASKMEGNMPKEIIKKRSEKLHHLSDEKKRIFVGEHVGRQHQVLFESAIKDGFMFGWTENYLKVKTSYDTNLVNQIKTATLGEPDEELVCLIRFPDTTQEKTIIT
jgi:threonylcarbamoyladenosine tRNA methylthiotransferase MtaB